MMYKVRDEPDLVRDENGVIRNISVADYRAYMTKRQSTLENKQRIQRLEDDNKEIKETLSIILQLLMRENK